LVFRVSKLKNVQAESDLIVRLSFLRSYHKMAKFDVEVTNKLTEETVKTSLNGLHSKRISVFEEEVIGKFKAPVDLEIKILPKPTEEFNKVKIVSLIVSKLNDEN